MPFVNLDENGLNSYGYDNLPDVILLKIFRLLNVGDLCKAGRVCTHWYQLTRSPVLWKRVDTCDMQLTSYQVCKFVPILPPCVVYLRISSFSTQQRIPFLTPHVVSEIRKRCPMLHTLIIESAFVAKQVHFTDITIEDFPQNLCVLSLRKSFFHIDQLFYGVTHTGVPKIKVLDCSSCWCVKDYDMPFFTRLSDLQEVYLAGCPITDIGVAILLKTADSLRVLDLEGTFVGDQTVALLSEQCRYLEKLFLGFAKVSDSQFCLLSSSSLPRLKSLCVARTEVTTIGLRSIVTALHSLKYLYVDTCNLTTESTLEIASLVPQKQNLKLIYSKLHFTSSYCDHFLVRSKEN